MSDTEAWQVSDNAAIIYERDFVPAIFRRWPPAVIEAAQIRVGDRVLDVGCGTGVLAREIASRLGSKGNVTGIDLNPGMLMVARNLDPGIQWRQGDAGELPFADGQFDVAVSQFALMFFANRERALEEMWRVIAPGGRIAVAVWAALERSRGYALLAQIAERRTNAQAAAILRAPFVLGDSTELLELFRTAGILNTRLETRNGFAVFPSISELVRIEVKGSPLDNQLDEPTYQALVSEASEKLAEFCDREGRVSFPLDAHIVSATKP